MSTEQDLHQALINHLTKTLNHPPEGGVDPKIVEWSVRFLEKKEISSIAPPPEGSFEDDKVAKLKKDLGVE